MRVLLHGTSGTLLLGFLIGIVALWVAGHMMHIPGAYAPNSPTTSFTPSTGPGNAPSYNSYRTSSNSSSPSDKVSLPLSIPVYTPSSASSNADNKVVFSSPSPSYTVLNYYGEELSTNGWKIITESTENGSTTINATGNGYTISVTITSASNNGSQFTIQTS